ncbi:hypothetical protein [Mesorhizobium sp. dw_380]|uniref:hypothetical protein n=1 Tax=Mesorhizobium sp. dw_380 TaxID=2812001 RepID=UPI001BDDF42D|nr:hypothetical protein [Mesorhizobium sp. dw_380]
MSEEKRQEPLTPCIARDREPTVTLADFLGGDIAAMNVNTTAEIRRLAGNGRRRTEIAALLRCPYHVVDEALSGPGAFAPTHAW